MLWERRVLVSNDLPIRGGLLRENKIMKIGQVQGEGRRACSCTHARHSGDSFWWWVAEQSFELWRRLMNASNAA